MQLTVVKEFTFDAAHYLPEYDGKCANLHGHHYTLQVGFKGGVDKETGIVVDFSQIKRQIGKLIDRLDHTYLNDVGLIDFPKYMPTAENMVIWLIHRIQTAPLDFVEQLEFVRLYETPTSYAEWRKEEKRYNWLGVDQEELEETLRRR